MDEQKEAKPKPCCCTVLVGALVIVFAWWQSSWSAIALTALGVVIIFKTLMPGCCCRGDACKTGKQDREKGNA
ncbi:MAG TPA: hypothetical protein PLL75_02435 [Candidatus Omnitrophota bacterium]|nr:hypothetical protein [Candidatus Omnitrophota bacterium]HPS36570.1 hypothetical protein [Candidatus Omnitrophota bacterium]